MKILQSIILACLSVSLAHAQLTDSSCLAHTKLENRIFDKVMHVQEVQALCRVVDSVSEGEHGVRFCISERPSKKSKYYWVQVSEANDFMEVIDYNFRVDPGTLDVTYLDTVNDTVIDLKIWRKQKNKSHK